MVLPPGMDAGEALGVLYSAGHKVGQAHADLEDAAGDVEDIGLDVLEGSLERAKNAAYDVLEMISDLKTAARRGM